MNHNPKRVCFFSGDISRSGGTEKVAIQIMNGLADTFSVSVVNLTLREEKCFYPLREDIPNTALFPTLPNGLTQFGEIVHRLRSYLRKNQIDVLIDVDTVLDMFSIPAVKLLKMPNVRMIAWEHFNFHETMGNRFRMLIRKHLTHYADAVVTLTKEDQAAFREAYGDKTRIEQIYNPILFESGEKPYDTVSKTLISVGRLSAQKGFDYLIDAALLVQKKHPDWKWLILGEGEDRPKLEEKMRRTGCSIVQLAGRVSNVADYLQTSAMFVLTSRYEGFPLALIEAKANRLPVVSFACKTGPAELVQDGINGYLVDCYDTEMMAERICELIGDEEKRRSFSENAALDTEKMNYEGIVEQWTQLLNSL